MIALDRLNAFGAAQFTAALAGIFEHSPWVAQRAARRRPFASAIALHHALSDAVMHADADLQLDLIRAHPELAGRAAVRGELTAASRAEQHGAGLSACTAEQLDRLKSLNAEYGCRFGFPFVIAVKGLTPAGVIDQLEQRVQNQVDEERQVALSEICRIARFRLADLIEEELGASILSMAEDLAQFSDTDGTLSVSYLTPAHRAVAALIREFMLAAGLSVHIDALGNVVGVLRGAASRRLLTGSHYDTVINAGKFDGRLGIALPIAVAGALRRAGELLPYSLEIIAFAEEEGVRFKSTFLGSRAVAGHFNHRALDAVDDKGMSMRAAICAGGSDVADIAAIARDPEQVLGFVEVHIEQGPVLLDADRAVGVVTGIAGSVRSVVTVEGLSGHAGTVPMALRRDAAAAAAEMVLAVERRCQRTGLVGTVGKLVVPDGAINVIAGRCEFSIDIRSLSDAARGDAARDVNSDINRIAARRGVRVEQREVLAVTSVPCAAVLQDAWSDSVQRVTGAAALRLPSGAGHDAMMMARLTNVGMLFVRCGNGGISHHPAETLSAADAAVAARVFEDFLKHYAASP